jgi:hypothetical protein
LAPPFPGNNHPVCPLFQKCRLLRFATAQNNHIPQARLPHQFHTGLYSPITRSGEPSNGL